MARLSRREREAIERDDDDWWFRFEERKRAAEEEARRKEWAEMDRMERMGM